MNVFVFVFILATIFAHYFHDCVGGLLGSVPFARINLRLVCSIWHKDTENICKGVTTTTLLLICTIHEGVTGIHHCTIMVVSWYVWATLCDSNHRFAFALIVLPMQFQWHWDLKWLMLHKKKKERRPESQFFFLFILFNIICSSLHWSETAMGPLYIVNCCRFRGWGGRGGGGGEGRPFS